MDGGRRTACISCSKMVTFYERVIGLSLFSMFFRSAVSYRFLNRGTGRARESYFHWMQQMYF